MSINRKSLTTKKIDSFLMVTTHLHMHLKRYRSSRSRRKQHRLERDSKKLVKSGKGKSDGNFLTSVLQRRWPLGTEFPSQTKQNKVLEYDPDVGVVVSLLVVQLLLLSLAGFPSKIHTSQVCK